MTEFLNVPTTFKIDARPEPFTLLAPLPVRVQIEEILQDFAPGYVLAGLATEDDQALADGLRKLLADTPHGPPPPTIAEVVDAAAKAFGLTPSKLRGKSKLQEYAYPRHLAMALARELTRKSYPQIGRVFGRRDHTTVMYAVDRVAQLQSMDPERVAHDRARVLRELEAGK